ncbi:hypothetical protein [Spirulina subsalsa]|uniref:hypothetical protein n=1 Tax=Spirulina subsalsa TaxID=54311 RepID=UPI0002DD1EE0|nr:hypothetical protein [Spirulina subsalsa]
MKRTVSIPVNLPRERFLLLMGFCADIFNQHVDWALMGTVEQAAVNLPDVTALVG